MDTENTPGYSIAKRLIIAVVLFSTFITVLTSAIQLYSYYDRDVDAIYYRLTEIRNVHLKILSKSVWTADKTEVIKQLDSMLSLPGISYLEVMEGNEKRVYVGVPGDSKVIKRTYPIVYQYRGAERLLGKLKIEASLDTVYQNLIDQVWIILVSNGIKTFLVTGFIFLIFQYLVTRHLHKIAEFADALNISNLDKQLSLDRSNKSGAVDELDIVVTAIQGMQVNLALSLSELKERDTRLSIYEKIMSTTSDQMAFINRSYIHLAVNQAYGDLYEATVEEITGSELSEIFGQQEFLRTIKPKLDQAFQGKVVQYETAISVRDKTIPVDVRYIPYYGEDNEIQGLVIHLCDLSERLRNHNVYRALARSPAIKFDRFLQDSLALLAEVFHAKYALVGRLNEDKKQVDTEALYVDGQFVENVTYDLAGTPCRDVLNCEQQIITENVIERYPEDTLLVELDAQSYFGAPLVSTEGNIMGIVIVLDDKPRAQADWYAEILSVVAARIEIEMERADALHALDEHRKNLEAKVVARTGDLQQANKELESFSYSVSHDLRTPLRAINGYCVALVEDCGEQLPETALEYLNRVRDASIRMSSLIDSLLQLSRISRQSLAVETLDLSAMAQEVVDELAVAKDISHIQFDIGKNMQASGDKQLISIVLLNLLDNAVKYSAKKDKPVIKFGQSDDVARGKFVIQDNGMGFDMRFKDKLFIPFQRLHDDKQVQGIGIGLATVHRIIMRHQGQVDIESQVDGGTSVYISF